MTNITLDEAAKRTLKEVVGEACAKQETIVVTGPQGVVARIVPAGPPTAPPPSAQWKGRPVRDAEALARMSPEELASAGWVFPDESVWVDEIASAPGTEQRKRD